ncbi:MAG: hypothetical protein WC451_01530 [Patescibacteria group bacterium]|jgi:hypothetical protein
MENEKNLIESIIKLKRATDRSNSLGWMILKGIFYSIGWVIGLGIIATILFYILPQTGEGNIIGKFIHAMSDALRQNNY